MLAPAGAVHGDLLPSKLGAGDLNGTNALNVPSDAEVDLPDLPMLKEDCAPDRSADSVQKRVTW